MAYKVQGQVTGLAETLATLEGIKAAVRNRILRAAVTAGARLIAKKAKALAPRELGLLRKSIGQVVRVYRNSGVVVAVVGPRKGFRLPAKRKKGKWRETPVPPAGHANPLFYAHLVELGVAPHRIGKGSSTRKKTGSGRMHPGHPAKPFLTPAATGQAAAVGAAMAKAVTEGLARAVAKGKVT